MYLKTNDFPPFHDEISKTMISTPKNVDNKCQKFTDLKMTLSPSGQMGGADPYIPGGPGI